MTVLEIVKSKLSEPLPSDQEIESLIDEVSFTILNYCNLKEVPEALKYVLANMVVDLIKGKQREDSEDGAPVSSIKEGDVTVQFGTVKIDSSEQAMKGLLYSYREQLNRFRRLRW